MLSLSYALIETNNITQYSRANKLSYFISSNNFWAHANAQFISCFSESFNHTKHWTDIKPYSSLSNTNSFTTIVEYAFWFAKLVKH